MSSSQESTWAEAMLPSCPLSPWPLLSSAGGVLQRRLLKADFVPSQIFSEDVWLLALLPATRVKQVQKEKPLFLQGQRAKVNENSVLLESRASVGMQVHDHCPWELEAGGSEGQGHPQQGGGKPGLQ